MYGQIECLKYLITCYHKHKNGCVYDIDELLKECDESCRKYAEKEMKRFAFYKQIKDEQKNWKGWVIEKLIKGNTHKYNNNNI